jgi:hypothetical protein
VDATRSGLTFPLSIKNFAAFSSQYRLHAICRLSVTYVPKVRLQSLVARQPARLYHILAMIGPAGIGLKGLLRARKLLIPRTRKKVKPCKNAQPRTREVHLDGA